MFFKVPTPCLDEHNFKKEELEPFGELSKRNDLMYAHRLS